ncbi:MAG: beta-lactamase family protein, partial [Gemmatimonadetes bacterium]|nr:beta-lactamase family protein [Gemmatimonadota bacterium]
MAKPSLPRPLIATLFGLLTAAAPAAAQSAALDRVVEAARAGGFSGVVLVGDTGSVLYERAVGTSDRESGRALSPADPWRWASVSKQVTSVLVMQQVEAGRLSLDATVADLLPTFRGPNARQITVRQLLQHTSGLPNPTDTPGADGIPGFYRTPVLRGSVDAAAAAGYCSGTPKAEPGARFEYNNCDYLVLGAILERVTGMTYADLLERRIARPLGLRTLRVRRSGDRPERVAGYLDTGARDTALDLGTYSASGGLYGTPRDLLAFDRALLRGTLLSPASRDQLWAGDPKLGYAGLAVWSFPARLAGCARPVQLVERRGHIGGIQVRNILVPSRGIAVIAFANSPATEFGEVWQGKGLTHD